MTMSLRQFIEQNRGLIDAFVKQQYGGTHKFDDQERELWVLNEKSLKEFAKRKGVIFDEKEYDGRRRLCSD